jgi:hypothetical protein
VIFVFFVVHFFLSDFAPFAFFAAKSSYSSTTDISLLTPLRFNSAKNIG